MWNYRLIRHDWRNYKAPEEVARREKLIAAATGKKKEYLERARQPRVAIHEVYYDEKTKKPNACTLYPVELNHLNDEGDINPKEIAEELRRVADDIERYGDDILNWEDIGSEELVQHKKPEEWRSW